MGAPTFLLDTGVCIDILRNGPGLEKLPGLAQCQISQIVAAEPWTGAHKSERREINLRKVADFLSGFPLVDFDQVAARPYGDIRAVLEKKGVPIGPRDLLIAAQTRSVGSTLVTGNFREFRHVPDLQILAWK
jgi:tRNA(fMet)-specific endonuclease VapC